MFIDINAMVFSSGPVPGLPFSMSDRIKCGGNGRKEPLRKCSGVPFFITDEPGPTTGVWWIFPTGGRILEKELVIFGNSGYYYKCQEIGGVGFGIFPEESEAGGKNSFRTVVRGSK